jgi:hypothetical protein
MSTVRADDGERTVPTPEDNEVVIFQSFFKAGLRFPLNRFVVKVLKIYQVYLHQLTPEAIIRMGIFVWAVKSQGLEPNAKSFCNIQELVYKTKPWGKEQYHNNFGCCSFGARSGSSCPVPTFRKKWPGDWMKEWFYVKNDLKAREDIKDIIMCPSWQRFGLRKPKVDVDEAVEECQRAVDVVCSFIGTRDLVQEHIAFRVWLLVEKWEMPKETITKPDEGGLIRMKFTFRYEGKFVEPDDDWLNVLKPQAMNCLGHTQRQKILRYPRPSEAERRKGSTEFLMLLGLCTLTTATLYGGERGKMQLPGKMMLQLLQASLCRRGKG